MLSKSAARTFFWVGTELCFGSFILLTIDTIKRVPKQTNEHNLTESVIRGKELWEQNNCMGCHTLFGEGAYYAPELTKVYERRGEAFMKAIIKDPAKMYPNERQMVKYDFTDAQIDDLIAFFKWAGEVDLNGFPPKPDLAQMAVPASASQPAIAKTFDRPKVFNQMCIACHALEGQGGAVGPALDGVGDRMSREQLEAWIADPPAIKPGTTMPKLPLSPEDVKELAAFLTQLKGGNNP